MAKCKYVKEELGFDDCLDRQEPNLSERLKKACPNGIEIYIENVGGPVFDAVLPLLNQFARIPVCGLIAHYNDAEPRKGVDRLPSMFRHILSKRLKVEGFVVFDHNSQIEDFKKDMSDWLRTGRIKYRKDVTEGLEKAPSELIGLLKGNNFGKKIIKVSGEND